MQQMVKVTNFKLTQEKIRPPLNPESLPEEAVELTLNKTKMQTHIIQLILQLQRRLNNQSNWQNILIANQMSEDAASPLTVIHYLFNKFHF